MPTIENLSLPNFSDNNIVEESILIGDVLAGVSLIALLNGAGFFANDYLCTNPEEPTGELSQIQAISGQNITMFSGYSIMHRSRERVVKLFGNQIKIYKTADVNGLPPADSAFLAGYLGVVSIDADSPFSYFTDTNGGIGYWYKFTYYNQTSLGETDISLSEPMRGGGFGHYVSLEDIRDEAGLEETRLLDDTQVAARREEAESEVKGKLAAAGYIMPLQTGLGVGYIPALVRTICRILAAGFILSQNFGTTKPDTAKDGAAKQKTAREMLAEIQLNDIVLLDANEKMLAKNYQVAGWPDNTTAFVGTDGITPEPSQITMSMRF